MISKKVLQLFLICALVALYSLNAIAAEEDPLAKFSKILPEKVGDFRKSGADKITVNNLELNGNLQANDFKLITKFHRVYKRSDGLLFEVEIYTTNSEESAYSLFSIYDHTNWTKCNSGVVCFRLGAIEHFAKGTSVVSLSLNDKRSDEKIKEAYPLPDSALDTLAKLIGDNLETGENDVPPLVKHLPDWENKQTEIYYVLTHNALKYASRVRDSNYVDTVRPIIDSVPFENGSEAVVAFYEQQGILIIIEYPTPQIASDADQKITQKINELKSKDLLIKTVYKRVGNYSVFVFDAPDEATANNLISQVDYGKTVQWLYGDPFEYDRANRQYLLTTGGIIVTVLKTAGIALLFCFAIGGGFGYFVFMRRRKQQAMSTAFSDAGGMMRLNLDEMTAQRDPARLLEK